MRRRALKQGSSDQSLNQSGPFVDHIDQNRDLSRPAWLLISPTAASAATLKRNEDRSRGAESRSLNPTPHHSTAASAATFAHPP